MVLLTESGLNKRHREFNRKVIKAAEMNVNFDDVKAEGAKSDIDNLFIIDLASKYKNIDYILEVLKSADSLCITRALKCNWIYDSEYSYIINPQFINDNIFPNLSLKFKRKLLTTISVYVRDEDRAFDFYKYCNTLKYYAIAFKFLLFTSERTKISLLRENFKLIEGKGWTYFRNFIGDSFTLTEIYLEVINDDLRSEALHELRYLYTVIGVKYLDLLEKYKNPDRWYTPQWFGLRMSKDIILKRKDRIYQKPLLYTKHIKSTIFVKHSTVEDAKFYIIALLPRQANDFWTENYYRSQRHFFEMIHVEEKYQFIKKIFNDKYPGEPFEMTVQFYKLRYHNLIIDLDLKEEWALRHVESQNEILGPNRDFLWYQFVKFEKSFDAIKKYIRITVDPDARAEITNILIECARTDRELETLFNYYYERHVNEEMSRKERFLCAVSNRHNVFNFDSDCFAAFDKLYYSLEVYNVLSTYQYKSNYKLIGLIYRIINKMEMPEALIKFLNASISYYSLYCYTSKLIPENVSLVYEYFIEFYVNNLKHLDDQPYDESVKFGARKYIRFILDLMCRYDKPKAEIPPLVIKFVNLDWEEYKSNFYFRNNVIAPEKVRFTPNVLLRCLKQDNLEFVSKFSLVKKHIKRDYEFKLNHVLRKLRVYFSNDLAKEYLKLYENTLNEPDLVKHAVDVFVFGIFHLADKEYLNNFMIKHAPTDSKIDHVHIDRKLLSIQRAICSFAGYARPPVPLSNVLKYIKGDYTQYCLPLFNMYLANLQPNLCMEFVKSIVDAPLSLQKHGLRLAFQCFAVDDLKKVIAEMWRRTKNVSLRLIIYKALHYKILEVNKNDQWDLFQLLNYFTSTVYEEDENELFCLLTSDALPTNLICEHLKTVWKTFDKLPFKKTFIEYRDSAVKCLDRNLFMMEPKSFIEKIIDEHIQYVFEVEHDDESYIKLKEGGVVRSKWYLTIKYISFLKDGDDIENKLKLTRTVTSKCFEKWHEVINDANVYRNFFREFLNLLKCRSYSDGLASYIHVNLLFQQILKDLEEALPLEDIYQTVWDLNLHIRARNIIIEGNDKKKCNSGSDIVKEAGVKLGKEFVALVLEFIEKEIFWIMFDGDIRKSISYEVSNIVNNLQGIIYGVAAQDILLLVCNELTEIKRFETFFLASKMLEATYSRCRMHRSMYDSLVNKLNTFGDKQMKCFMYQKFGRNNNSGTKLI